MELIKLTQSKLSNPSNLKSSRRFGIFECPVCLKQIEKSLTSGNKAKTCGDNECRTAAMLPTNKQHRNKKGALLVKRTFNYTNMQASSHLANTLYLIRSGNFIKIGVTSDLAKRFIELQSSNPIKISVEYSIKLQSPFSLEAYLHKFYAAYNIHAEWFNLSKSLIDEIIEYASSTIEKGVWAGDKIIVYKESTTTEKPKITTITNEDLSHITSKKSKTFKDAVTIHGMHGTFIYDQWQAMKGIKQEIKK